MSLGVYDEIDTGDLTGTPCDMPMELCGSIWRTQNAAQDRRTGIHWASLSTEAHVPLEHHTPHGGHNSSAFAWQLHNNEKIMYWLSIANTSMTTDAPFLRIKRPYFYRIRTSQRKWIKFFTEKRQLLFTYDGSTCFLEPNELKTDTRCPCAHARRLS